MTAQEMAARLDGREYCEEMTQQDERDAKADGLVVVFGASDDLMEFRGAISDEIGAWEGVTVHITSAGIPKSECNDDDCPYFARQLETAATIEAMWCPNGNAGPSWAYKTSIPHATFLVREDGEDYCAGIVFALTDVPGGGAR